MNKLVKQSFLLDEYFIKNFLELSSDELEFVRMLRNSERIRKWMYNDKEISKKEHNQFVNSLAYQNTKAYWLVLRKQNRKNRIGVIYLTNIDFYHRRAYLGIYSAIKGGGIVLIKLITWLAFNKFNLHTLKLEVIETNEKAIKLYHKMGFKQEGILRDYVFKEGKWLNVIVMGMTEEEYRNANIKL